MRRSGKTTRAIDEAVQLLFNGKNLAFFIPDKNYNPNEELLRLVDPDWTKGIAQNDFFKRFLRRLKNEHHLILKSSTGLAEIEVINLESFKTR